MSKPKLRKIAKNIAKLPKLKKLLAEYLTEDALVKQKYDTKKMLLQGHRGFMAMSEKELTDLFDKRYVELEKELEAMVGKNLDEDRHWAEELGIESKKESILKANEIYDEIFEEVFL